MDAPTVQQDPPADARRANPASGDSPRWTPRTARPNGWLLAAGGVAGVVVLFGAASWFVQYWTHGRFVQSTDDAYIQADQVTVATRVSGFVDQVFVADNQDVRAGQPLVKIDERDPRARLQQALAQADQARASVAQFQAQIRQQQAQIAQAQAQLSGAAAQRLYATQEAARYAPLAASGAETAEKLAQMRENQTQAEASVAQYSAALEAARRQVATQQAQVQLAQAQIEQAQAQAQQARVDLDATLVRASIDGRTGDTSVRVGQFVQPGTRMMSVVPLHNIYVTANFKETQLGLMRLGQPVTIKVDALKGQDLHGVVQSFSPGTGGQFALIPPNNATGNFTKIVQRLPTRIRIDADADARKVLAPGMSVTVAVDTIDASPGHATSQQRGAGQ